MCMGPGGLVNTSTMGGPEDATLDGWVTEDGIVDAAIRDG